MQQPNEEYAVALSQSNKYIDSLVVVVVNPRVLFSTIITK